MKKLLLLIMLVAITALTYVSCGSSNDNEDSIKNYVDIHLNNSYLIPCQDIQSLSYIVTVREYDASGNYEGSTNFNGTLSPNDFVIPSIEVPYHSVITVEIVSNDCSTCCDGSCPLEGVYIQRGYPKFSASQTHTVVSTDFNDPIYINPQIIDCY